jgi:hypothetical protein
MGDILKIKDSETENEALWRIGKAKENGLLGDITWPTIAEVFNKHFRESEETYYDSSAYRKRFRNFLDAYEQLFSKEQFTDEQINEYAEQKRELQVLKMQIQTEKLENNRWLREHARDELIAEHICSAIKELPPLEVPSSIGSMFQDNERAGVLLIADAHYGAELEIKGLFGEILNEYNPNIFEKRMWDLLVQVVHIVKKEGFNELNVYDLGDNISGLLRVSQLMKLRYGVIESAVRYGRFITEWLNELTKYVRVKYQMVFDSNHNQLRLLGQPKNTFKDENISMIITEKILDRLENNPNFEFIQNPTGYIFDNLVGFNVFGLHGEVKNRTQAIKDFSSTYKVDIDFLVAGHKHHGANEQVGIASDVISAPSIIGIDDYSMSLHKTSDPGATLFVLEADKGKTMEYNIKL